MRNEGWRALRESNAGAGQQRAGLRKEEVFEEMSQDFEKLE